MSSESEQIQAAAAELRLQANETMSHLWWAFMLRGVFALVLGLCALIWPGLTLGLLVRLLGIYALFDGITELVSGIRSRNMRGYLLSALISLIVGAILLFMPGLTLKLVLIILGVWSLLHGVNLLLAGRSMLRDDPDRGLLMTMGTVQTVIGLVLIVWPEAGIVTVSWLVAGFAFVVGAMLIFLATRLRRVNQRLASMGNMPR